MKSCGKTDDDGISSTPNFRRHSSRLNTITSKRFSFCKAAANTGSRVADISEVVTPAPLKGRSTTRCRAEGRFGTRLKFVGVKKGPVRTGSLKSTVVQPLPSAIIIRAARFRQRFKRVKEIM